MNSARLTGIVDQATSSAGNMAITIVAARALDPTAFGGFAVAFAVYIVVAGMARALAAEPLLLEGREDAARHRGEMAGAMAMLGAVAGAVCIAASAVSGGRAARPLIVLGLFLPLLLVEDAWRYAGFATERPGEALFVDMVWLSGQAVATVVVVVRGTTDPAALMAAWAGAGSVAAIAGAIRFGAAPKLRAATTWIRSRIHLGGPFTAEFLASGGAAYVDLWLLGLVAGLAAVGAVRVGQTVFGPINVLYVGMYMTLVPEAARRVREGPRSVRDSLVRASAMLFVLAAGWTVLALVLPAPAGRALFGDSWASSRPTLAPLGLSMCAGGVMAGAIAGLRALGAARLSLRTRLWTLPPTLVLPVVGALVGDEVGFCVGVAAAACLSAALWWRAFGRALAAVASDEGAGSAPELFEQPEEGLGRVIPRQLVGPGAAGDDEAIPKPVVTHDPDDGVGPGRGPVRIDEQSGVPDHLG